MSNNEALYELEQKVLDLMLFVCAQTKAIKEAKKDIDQLLKQIEDQRSGMGLVDIAGT